MAAARSRSAIAGLGFMTEHRPGQLGKYDAEGNRTFAPVGDVCLGCSDEATGLWVPVSQCPIALAVLDEFYRQEIEPVMIVDQRGTHLSHCCLMHGCKYGDDTCPVENDTAKQDHPCEDCTPIADLEMIIRDAQAQIDFQQNLMKSS
jgi:hypothetical protein